MHRFVSTGVLLPLAAAVVAGCGADGHAPHAADPPSSTTPTAAGTGATIPDGTYSKTATLAQARALGVTNRQFVEELGPDGRTTYTYKFDHDRWTLFVVEGAAPEPGDTGTLSYDADGTVSMISESEGCPGCVYVYDWRLVGDRLSLRIVEHEASADPQDLAAVRFVSEGVFRRGT